MFYWISEYKESETYRWCIVLKDNKNPIGSISVVSFNTHVETLEIGYCIGRNYWNQGLEAVLVKSGFRYTGLRGRVAVNNIGRCDVIT